VGEVAEGARLVWLKPSDVRIPDVRLRSRLEGPEEEAFRASIKDLGVLQPIQVIEDPKARVYWLVDGEHRVRAALERSDLIPAIVRMGTVEDAIVGSGVYNILRGRVNPVDLAVFLKYVHEELGMSLSKIEATFHLSKGYASKLIRVAGSAELLAKIRRGELTFEEAYESLSKGRAEGRGFPTETPPAASASSAPPASKGAFQPETPPAAAEVETTGSLREALEAGKRFEPAKLGVDDRDLGLGAAEGEKARRPRRCDFCGQWMKPSDFGWIVVHREGCLEKALDLIRGVTVNPQPQPGGEERASAGEGGRGGDKGG
jgi:ParB/RepB/Spo0J family partition protein